MAHMPNYQIIKMRTYNKHLLQKIFLTSSRNLIDLIYFVQLFFGLVLIYLHNEIEQIGTTIKLGIG